MNVPFLDLKSQYRTIESEILTKVTEVLRSGSYILGPYVSEFEAAFARHHEAAHCVATNNGTSALHLALWALGIGPGDEVIVPVNTFAATAEAVVLCGATPVFVDQDEFSNIDVDRLSSALTPRTKAVIAVHLYGQPARMDAIHSFCQAHGLQLIEDAAQAHLARFQGKPVGSWGTVTCFSFYPGKNLGAYGEGGACLTNDPKIDAELRLLRDHGSRVKYEHLRVGHNYRLEALQAAILTVKLEHLKHWTAQRKYAAATYVRELQSFEPITLPRVHPDADPVWHLFVIETTERDCLQTHLAEVGVGTGLHYPRPLHLQPAFQTPAQREGRFPRAEVSAGRLLSLPMFPEISEEQITYVCNAIRAYFR